jgi:hypothetical protein
LLGGLERGTLEKIVTGDRVPAASGERKNGEKPAKHCDYIAREWAIVVGGDETPTPAFSDTMSVSSFKGKDDKHRRGNRSLGIALSFVVRARATLRIDKTAVSISFPKEES